MKTSEKTKKHILAAVFVAAAIVFIAGCGGGGNGVSIGTSVPAVSALADSGLLSSAEKDVYYDIDVDPGEGRAASRAALETASGPLSDLLALKTSVENLPSTAFIKVSKKQIFLGEMKRIRLNRIIKNIEMDVRHNNFRTALSRVERKLIPRVDGCSGGKTQDDYLLDCGAKTSIYNTAIQMRSLLTAYIAANPKGGRHAGREAAVLDLASFKNDLLSKINNLKTYITNLPVSAFNGAVTDPRGVLLDILTVAINYAIDGEFDSVKTEMNDSFVPYVDGLNGDDLIVEPTARQNTYNSALAIIQEVSVTAVAITPISSRLKIAGTQDFIAECTYSAQYIEECTDRVTWASSNASVGTIDSTGTFTASAEGTANVTASYGAVISNTAVVMVDSPYMSDSFDAGYLDPEKWNDFTNTGTIAIAGGKVVMTGPRNQYSEIATSHYFDITPGELVTFEIDIDLSSSFGEYYVAGFGISDNSYAGIAIGLAGGNSVNGTLVYYSSPLRGAGGTTYVNDVRNGKFRVEYQNGTANLYLGGVLVQTFSADLDGKRLSFFVFGSAGWGNSYYDMLFDNFKTNQPYPGDTNMKVINNTSPFGIDGSGYFSNGDSYTIRIVAAPGQTDVTAGIMDPSDLKYIVQPSILTEVSSGVYETTGNLPLLSSTSLAAVGTDDGFQTVALHTRRIAVSGGVAPRIAGSITVPMEHPILKLFPTGILPSEITSGGF